MNPSGEDFEYLREKMVREQLLARDIKDKSILEVFGKIQRHRFVDLKMCRDAYGDFPLSIGKGQTISQPYIVALMVQLLELKKHDRVLEIGTGSGYETSVLAELSDKVYSVERIDTLAENAKKVLGELGYGNVFIKVGDGTLGWQEFAPFDKIVVTASSMDVPAPLLDQLSQAGKMVMPVGPRYTQRLMVLEKSKKGLVSRRDVCGCVFVPLIGRYGWEDSNARKNI